MHERSRGDGMIRGTKYGGSQGACVGISRHVGDALCGVYQQHEMPRCSERDRSPRGHASPSHSSRTGLLDSGNLRKSAEQEELREGRVLWGGGDEMEGGNGRTAAQ